MITYTKIDNKILRELMERIEGGREGGWSRGDCIIMETLGGCLRSTFDLRFGTCLLRN